MCSSNGRFHYINPNTQLALFSICVGDCSSVKKIEWNIYEGSTNLSNETVRWTLVSPTTSSWLYGKSFSHSIKVIQEGFSRFKYSEYHRSERILRPKEKKLFIGVWKRSIHLE